MATVTNPSRQPVTLPTGHVVPSGGKLTTTNAVLRIADNVPFLRGQTISGALAVEYDPDLPPRPVAGPSITTPEATPSSTPAPKPRKSKE